MRKVELHRIKIKDRPLDLTKKNMKAKLLKIWRELHARDKG